MIENNNDEVLILGLPNSGKSTLVNVLTSKKASIICLLYTSDAADE